MAAECGATSCAVAARSEDTVELASLSAPIPRNTITAQAAILSTPSTKHVIRMQHRMHHGRHRWPTNTKIRGHGGTRSCCRGRLRPDDHGRDRASKATIYRRWSGKAELVVAAIERRPTAHPKASQAADLRGTLRTMQDALTGQDARLLLDLMTAMHHDDDLARTVREKMVDSKRRALEPALARARARDELSTTADPGLLAEMCSAMLFSWAFMTGQPLDDAFLTHLVDQILLPLLRIGATGECGCEGEEGIEVVGVAFVSDGEPVIAGQPGGWVGRAARCQSWGWFLFARPPAEPDVMVSRSFGSSVTTA